MHGLALTLLGLLLLGHFLLQSLVLLSQLHILLHGLVEQLKLAIEVRGSFWAQAGLFRRTSHLFIVYRQIGDNLLNTLLLNGCVVGFGRERLFTLSFLSLEEGALRARVLLSFQILSNLARRLDFRRRTLSLGSCLCS